jgi:hypothetical protein
MGLVSVWIVIEIAKLVLEQKLTAHHVKEIGTLLRVSVWKTAQSNILQIKSLENA